MQSGEPVDAVAVNSSSVQLLAGYAHSKVEDPAISRLFDQDYQLFRSLVLAERHHSGRLPHLPSRAILFLMWIQGCLILILILILILALALAGSGSDSDNLFFLLTSRSQFALVTHTLSLV